MICLGAFRVPAHHLASLMHLDVPVREPGPLFPSFGHVDVVIDARIGYGLSRAPREPTASLTRVADDMVTPVAPDVWLCPTHREGYALWVRIGFADVPIPSGEATTAPSSPPYIK